MGLTSALARLGARRLHVLVVEAPGAFSLRARVERACLARGWALALSPADADALLVCAGSGDEAFATAVERVWTLLPGPRVRAEVSVIASVSAVLDRLAAEYQEWTAARDVGSDDRLAQPDEGHGLSGHEMSGHDMSGHEMSGHDMSGHMSGPGGISLASGAEGDRDGLEMDALHLQLGPVLPLWPTGLTVACTMHGDVVTHVQVLDVSEGPLGDHNGYRLDCAAQILALAGADDLAARVRLARDARLGMPLPAVDAAELRRRVKRVRLLRWSLRGVGVVIPQTVDENGWPAAWLGDAYDRLLRLLEEGPPLQPSLHVVADALPRLLPGAELATARLTVASLLAQPKARRATEHARTGFRA